MALPTNIGLGCSCLSGTNTLAYYKNPYIADKKRFITLAPGPKVIKLFMFINNGQKRFITLALGPNII
jgi:hypothetical protein